ncbi:MFS transporter [Pseudomonas sp. LP_7_YM]|uniref:MFS transporter n=1 Tax=Pseudomonas sp. LP_7_YM TaxID=2485137 RepID=UPI00105BD132|nr:MFS transporter [Pseudomonas sp. LP_7_YM]TDV72565.1 ACS family glucarate transporter-like MFS transporter [Pseudomonas sp. LP_7_YM]
MNEPHTFEVSAPPSVSTRSRAGAGVLQATHSRYAILALITVVLALSTGDRAALSVAGGDMSRELGVTSVELGYLFSAFSWAYVIFLIPSGWLADRIGSKKAMMLAVTLWSVFTVCMGLVHFIGLVVPLLLALRFLLGASESPVGPAAGRVIAAWFPSSERGMAGAIFNSAQYLSLALFTPFMGWLCHRFGWEYVFIIMGIVGLMIGGIWWRHYYLPIHHPKMNATELEYIRAGGGLVDLEQRPSNKQAGAAKRSQMADIGRLFKSRMMVGIFLGQYCITAITWFYMSWFPIYLVKERGFDILQAGFVAAIPALCGLIGGVSSGFVSDAILKKTGNLSLARKTPITLGLLLSASIMLCNVVSNETLVIALMSLAFFGKGFGSLGWTVVADTAPKELIGTTGGVFNAIGNMSGIVTPVVIGYLLQSSGSFASALIYVGAHGLIAVFSYWIIVGRIQRMELTKVG